MEFGSEVLDEKRARVCIKRFNENYNVFQNPEVYVVKHGIYGKILLTNLILDRFKRVSGMQNYDLILRYCEHITNYIAYGLWLSQQVNENFDGLNKNSLLFMIFRKICFGKHIIINALNNRLFWIFRLLRFRKERFINTFPRKIRFDSEYSYTDIFPYLPNRYLDREDSMPAPFRPISPIQANCL